MTKPLGQLRLYKKDFDTIEEGLVSDLQQGYLHLRPAKMLVEVTLLVAEL
ncbi:MAG: hypothetical protein VKJ24_14770 [Synechococcales bacterium]|nr:hypothetical protein [Synechococcales bacterium]